jgi:hypothetical protein
MLVETDISSVSIIITFNVRPVPDQRIEHHRGVHQVFIGRNSPPDIADSLHLGSRYDPVPRPDSLAMLAVRAVAVYGYISIGTSNSDPVFFLIPLERQGLHTMMVFGHPISCCRCNIYIGKSTLSIEII